MQATNDNEEDETDHRIAEACGHNPETTENNVIFDEFEHRYNKVLEVGGQLLVSCCALMCKLKQEMYKIKLKNSFKQFQWILR